MNRTALRLVEPVRFYQSELELWNDDKPHDAHSLHNTLILPHAFRPELPAYFIDQFSAAGDVVLDPFCGGGTTLLEAALKGRVAFGSDLSQLAVQISQAKLRPADFSMVALELQLVNLRRPVSLKLYRDHFSAFYDIDTFREIYHLRQYLLEKDDLVSRFLQFIALSLLHGHSGGYFSVYSLPQIALTPSQQEKLNIRRKQSPDYRAVLPRLLRKGAIALRDGIPSHLVRLQQRNTICARDARDLSHIPSESVDLVVTAPPLPQSEKELIEEQQHLWLKLWFLGMDIDRHRDNLFSDESVEGWVNYMHEVLFEMARVVKCGGRAVFDLGSISRDGEAIQLDQEIISLVGEQLSRYWEVEALFFNKSRPVKLRHSLRPRADHAAGKQGRILMLRRR